MRIAVVADIHGNLPALRAVLEDLDGERVDAVVVAGDVAGGPLVFETLELLASRPEPMHWISGNSEREVVAVGDGAPAADDPSGRAAAWSAQGLPGRWRRALASWPISVVIDGVRFCHGSPRRDDEVLTRSTPSEVLLDALSGVPERLIVGGHTHQQLVREVPGGRIYANAGSVGVPYEGRAGAFWIVVNDGKVVLRETSYDVDAALAELRASGFADVDDQFREALIDPVDPDWVTAFFEYGAGRGADPGPPPPSGGRPMGAES